MAFAFRLQKVLDYRHLLEEEAKQKYLDCKAARLKQEAVLAHVRAERSRSFEQRVSDVNGYLEIHAQAAKFGDDEVLAKLALDVLCNEEDAAEEAWHARRRDLETLEKLREQAKEEWDLEQSRREQAELDEWVVMRRSK